jgi:putative tricarboxylic transport membrane protein
VNRLRGLWGELALCLIFIAVAIFWIAVAAGMPMWDGFAPASGFMPLVYGVLMAVLAVAATLSDVLGAHQDAEAKPPITRPVMIMLALAAGVAGIEVAGFPVAMFLAMLFLFRVAERLPLLASLVTSAATALVLTLVFRTWLGVPLPSGPWGF